MSNALGTTFSFLFLFFFFPFFFSFAQTIGAVEGIVEEIIAELKHLFRRAFEAIYSDCDVFWHPKSPPGNLIQIMSVKLFCNKCINRKCKRTVPATLSVQ